jgi:hypothetical protein
MPDEFEEFADGLVDGFQDAWRILDDDKSNTYSTGWRAGQSLRDTAKYLNEDTDSDW